MSIERELDYRICCQSGSCKRIIESGSIQFDGEQSKFDSDSEGGFHSDSEGKSLDIECAIVKVEDGNVFKRDRIHNAVVCDDCRGKLIENLIGLLSGIGLDVSLGEGKRIKIEVHPAVAKSLLRIKTGKTLPQLTSEYDGWEKNNER